VGRRTLLHGLELTGVQAVLTVKPLVARLRQQGLDLAGVEERFVYLEDLGAGLGTGAKLWALLQGYLWWGSLRSAETSEVAAILFTSGSESLPKAVPLTHANILAELRDVLSLVGDTVSGRDRLLAVLPPFHSFGLAADVVLPLVAGLPAVYHPNPTEGPALAQTLAAYRATAVLATPTFLAGMLRAATKEQAASLRLAVTGAEECPPRVYQLLEERCPQALLLEGYGITECAPVVSLNLPEDPRPNTLGRLLPSLEHALVSVETGQPVDDDVPGLLLLRGPTVFPGYLGEAPDPFVEHAGQRWYRTGDLVRRSADGVFTFCGRLKRFVKVGGEMISLPAVEAVLQKAFPGGEEGPSLAVVATADERPELVLFATVAIDRQQANAALQQAGLSPLHNLRRLERLESLPLLGTGKTDYRSLQAMLEQGSAG
jgi:long-chain-fatty-acid--[acyl-carrier-protein] ligase